MAENKQYRWIKIAEDSSEIDFGANSIAEVVVDGKQICIGRYDGQLFAFAPKCPHAGGPFINGYIDALGNVVCPLHRYKFCLKNGRNVTGEGYYLKHRPVAVRPDGIFIGWEKDELFRLL